MKNYHTHTFRCNHADGDASDYAEAALNKGFTLLGISDHTPLPDNRWLYMRMGLSALPAYVRAIEEAQSKYTDLIILKGMECEWAPEYHNFFEDVLLGQYGFDYLILGSHFFPYGRSWLSSHGDITDASRLIAYTDFLIESMRSGLFAFVAHPDLFGLCYMDWDKNTEAASKEILSAAEELKIPLEINGYGLAKRRVRASTGERTAYPWYQFWELAAGYDITVVVNSDAHYPSHVDQGILKGREMAKSLGLTLANLEALQGR
ncbi:MAG TPA: histidinol-phosphatase [Firmicutes bacterium]|nr:histidinol-phosphatase [Bacillota bacterium]